jgi:hypothetical protein
LDDEPAISFCRLTIKSVCVCHVWSPS